MKTKPRINILSDIQIDEFYNVPSFTNQEMECFFALENDQSQHLSKYRTLKTGL